MGLVLEMVPYYIFFSGHLYGFEDGGRYCVVLLWFADDKAECFKN